MCTGFVILQAVIVPAHAQAELLQLKLHLSLPPPPLQTPILKAVTGILSLTGRRRVKFLTSITLGKRRIEES